MKKNEILIVVSLSLAAIFVLFQNCQRVQFFETKSLESQGFASGDEPADPSQPSVASPASLGCASGTSSVNSQNGSNTCQFSWDVGSNGATVTVLTSTGGGTLTGFCDNSTWQITTSCPNQAPPAANPGNTGGPVSGACVSHDYSDWQPCQSNNTQSRTLISSSPSGCSGGVAVVTSRSCTYVPPGNTEPPVTLIYCSSGSATVQSPDGSNSCAFSWPQTLAGTQNLIISGSNGGSISAHCSNGGAWTYSAQCPNTQAASCPAGNYTVSSPNGSNSCQFAWGFGNVGSSISAHTATGGGSVSGVCQATGWQTRFTCPDAQPTVTCPGGSGSVPSASGKPEGCYFVWPNTSAGSGYSGGGTNGGSISATCDSAGSWQGLQFSCP